MPIELNSFIGQLALPAPHAAGLAGFWSPCRRVSRPPKQFVTMLWTIVQAEASALITTPCEERIERFAPDFDTHSAAIVEKENFDMVTFGRQHFDVDRP